VTVNLGEPISKVAMRSRRFARAPGWLVLVALTTTLGCRHVRRPAPLRNLVLIVVDTLRLDHLAAYGYERETAPAFTRLASEGVLWNGISPTSWTKPATASILTGLHPVHHQAFGSADALPEASQTLAERLRARGYNTFGITANGWLSRTAGFAQGFSPYYSMLDDFGRGPFSTAEELNSKLLPRLRTLQPPFFLYVHYLDPHAPYDPPRDYRGRPLSGRLAARKGGIGILELRMSETLARPRELVEDAIDLYDGEIRRADDAIDSLLGELLRLGLADGTLTVVTSDHGEEMQEHGRMGHGQTLYEEVVRVPLLMHAPGVLPAGARFGTASLLDIVPTVLELLRQPLAGELDGISLAKRMQAAVPSSSAVEDTADVGRELLLHLDLEKPGPGIPMEAGRALALRGERFKLVLSEDPYRKALFDHRADPREQTDALARDPGGGAVFDEMAKHLADQYNVFSARSLARRTDEDAEGRAAMAALGYVGAGVSGSRPPGIPARIRPADRGHEGGLGWPVR
jgi:arylsulfatase A-like enzyme